jgi:hypothetical protein
MYNNVSSKIVPNILSSFSSCFDCRFDDFFPADICLFFSKKNISVREIFEIFYMAMIGGF